MTLQCLTTKNLPERDVERCNCCLLNFVVFSLTGSFFCGEGDICSQDEFPLLEMELELKLEVLLGINDQIMSQPNRIESNFDRLHCTTPPLTGPRHAKRARTTNFVQFYF